MSLFDSLEGLNVTKGEAKVNKSTGPKATPLVDMTLEELRAATVVRHYRRRDKIVALEGTVELTIMLQQAKVEFGAEYIAVPASEEEEATERLSAAIASGTLDDAILAVQTRRREAPAKESASVEEITGEDVSELEGI